MNREYSKLPGAGRPARSRLRQREAVLRQRQMAATASLSLLQS
jgi:hypothetical protein